MFKHDLTQFMRCRCCGKDHAIKMNADDFLKWKEGGELIQNAMPYLSVDDRELLISGTCKEGWARMFGETD